MTKKVTKPRTAKATKAQLRRINELGSRIYAFNWLRVQKEMVPKGLTKSAATQILYDLDKALGGNV